MTTEDVSPHSLDLDVWDTAKGVKTLYEGQLEALKAVELALPALASAVDEAVARLRRGGRIVYAGAGTSARIAVQDGAELFPTFNWPHEQVAFAIAGGEVALLRAVENAEDSGADGEARIDELGVDAGDVVIGVASSGATPFTVAAIKAARRRGALTIAIANNPGSPLLQASDHAILIETGAEAIAGSTRLKAGTAQKVALNLFSTMAMVRLGKVYRGRMVHMRPTNAKLRRRAVQTVLDITGCEAEAAATALTNADWDIKLAVLHVNGLASADARRLLEKHEGNLRAALAETRPR